MKNVKVIKAKWGIEGDEVLVTINKDGENKTHIIVIGEDNWAEKRIIASDMEIRDIFLKKGLNITNEFDII